MDMKTLYEDEMRQLHQFKVLEGTEEHDGRYFRVEKTGALLDLDNALSVSSVSFLNLPPGFRSMEISQLLGHLAQEFFPPFQNFSNANLPVFFSTCITFVQHCQPKSMLI